MEPEHFLIKKAFRLVSLFFSLLIPILRPYPKKGKATEDFLLKEGMSESQKDTRPGLFLKN